MGSLFFPVLWSSCTQTPLTFNARCSRGLFLPILDPRCGDLTWGRELSFLLKSLCDTATFQFVGCPLAGMGLLISHNHPSCHLDVAFSLPSGVYLFANSQSIWLKLAQHLIVNFFCFCFWRESELQSCYSTILIPWLFSYCCILRVLCIFWTMVLYWIGLLKIFL